MPVSSASTHFETVQTQELGPEDIEGEEDEELRREFAGVQSPYAHVEGMTSPDSYEEHLRREHSQNHGNGELAAAFHLTHSQQRLMFPSNPSIVAQPTLAFKYPSYQQQLHATSLSRAGSSSVSAAGTSFISGLPLGVSVSQYLQAPPPPLLRPRASIRLLSQLFRETGAAGIAGFSQSQSQEECSDQYFFGGFADDPLVNFESMNLTVNQIQNLQYSDLTLTSLCSQMLWRPPVVTVESEKLFNSFSDFTSLRVVSHEDNSLLLRNQKICLRYNF